ncbi:MAG: GNAT family N-acetyltransferase [Caldilineaceae bacterium]|nr:GNAT family N-acetyltransferase [Caldilineaceae bacterium]
MRAPQEHARQIRCADNHQQWMAAQATFQQGHIHQAEGALWMHVPGQAGEVTLAFPNLAEDGAAEQLDHFLAYCYAHRPMRQVSCWSLLPSQPADLGVRLLARGFEWGWQPHWMWLDFAQMRTDHAAPAGLQMTLVTPASPWLTQDLPYENAAITAMSRAASQATPRQLWHFTAWLDGTIVGHSILFVTTGPLAAAGIYNCGVVPAMRNRGIGKAVTVAACRQAHALGYEGVLLNATPLGRPVYAQLGFEFIGEGQTWWLHQAALSASPPTAGEITLVEAVGRGDIVTLARLAPTLPPAQLDVPIRNGMTLLEVAALLQQPQAADWLAAHGATLDILTARTLEWSDRIPALLAANPALANHRSGPNGVTPLHVAAWEDDRELIRLLLAAGADTTLRDQSFQATAAGWARHNGHLAAAELIDKTAASPHEFTHNSPHS